MKEYTNSQMSAIIDEHIHDKRVRTILRLRLCDHMTYSEIAQHEDVKRTERQVGYVLSKYIPVIAKYL